MLLGESPLGGPVSGVLCPVLVVQVRLDPLLVVAVLRTLVRGLALLPAVVAEGRAIGFPGLALVPLVLTGAVALLAQSEVILAPLHPLVRRLPPLPIVVTGAVAAAPSIRLGLRAVRRNSWLSSGGRFLLLFRRSLWLKCP